MSDDLVGFDDAQVARLKRMLDAFENGRLDNVFAPVPRATIVPLWTSIGKTTEVVSAAAGSLPGSGTVDRWHLDPVGLSLTNTGVSVEAYNPTGSTIASGSWVLLYRDPLSGQWICEPYASASGSLTIRDVLNTVTYASIGLVRFDTVQGFVLANPTAGEVNVSLRDADASQPGVVSTVAQSFGGSKNFVDLSYHTSGLSAGTMYVGKYTNPPVLGSAGQTVLYIDGTNGLVGGSSRGRLISYVMPSSGTAFSCEVWLDADPGSTRASIYLMGNVTGGGGTGVNANRPNINIATDSTGTSGVFAQGQTDTFLGITFISGLCTGAVAIDKISGGTW